MINIAIIGSGAIADAHIHGYEQFSDMCSIVALCDLYPEKVKDKTAKFNIDIEVYKDFKELLERDDIDLVSVCTPPYTHSEITVAALDAGKHVLVEKPMASSLKECDEMNEAAIRNNKILSVIAQNRFRTSMMRLKHVLDTKLMGSIVHAQADSFWWRGYSYYDLWWRGTWEKEGGGCTLNHAVHHIDLLRWMKGMPAEVTAMTSNTSHDNAEVEDISVAIGKYSDGSLAQITSSVVHHGEEQQLIFQGKEARVSAPWKVTASTAMENGFPVQNEQLEKELQESYESVPEVKYEGHTGQIEDVLLAVQGKKSVLCDGDEGRETLEFIMAIYESAATGKTVKLPLSEESPFYTREKVLNNATYFYEKKNSIANFNDNTITTSKDL